MTGTVAGDTALLEARIDKLTQALLHLASELWVTRDRQAVLERLLADHGIVAPDAVDTYRPDATLTTSLGTERDALVASLLGYLAADQ